MFTTRKHKRKDRWIKWFRVVAYSCMAVAGLMLLISPVLTDVFKSTAEVMAWFLLVGGTCSAVGMYREEWWGEFIGLPLLGSSFGVFGLISWAGTHDTYPYLAWANLLLLLGVGIAMAARWRDARNTYKIAMFGAKHDDEEPL